MGVIWITLMVVFGSALLSIAVVWLRFREIWTPWLAHAQKAALQVEQSRLRLGEPYLSREMLHPYVGYVLNPAADETVWKACGLDRPPVNSLGFASKFELPRRAQGKVTIAVLGGSVAQFLATDHQDALLGAMESTGAMQGKDVELHCLAVGGYKQPQQLTALTYLRSLGADFDVIVNLDGFNEIALHVAENAFKGTCYSFPRAWASRAAARVDPGLVFLFGQLAFIQTRRAALWEAMQRFPVNLLPPAYLGLRIVEARLRSRKARAIKSIRQFRPSLEQNLNTGLRDAEPVYQQLIDLWMRSSALMHEICRSAGTRYLHFLQPNQYVPNSKPLTAEEIETAFDPDHPYRAGVLEGYPLLKVAGQRLREHGVAFTDLTMLFRDCRESVYADRCCHFNRRGNEIISNAIATQLARSLPERSAARG